MKDIIKAVIVDDVDSMRIVLKKLLGTFDKIQIIGEAADFEEARNIISEERPDLLFLDIDLNGLTSLDLLKTIDYLLKPISFERLTKAIEKVTNKWEDTSFVDDYNTKFTADHIILLSFDNKMSFVRIKDINYIEAYGNYTKVNLVDDKLSVTYNSIKNWDTKLPEDLFIQIHRSTIVNLHNVTKIEKWANDTGRLYLKGIDKPFEISRNYFFQIKKKYKM